LQRGFSQSPDLRGDNQRIGVDILVVIARVVAGWPLRWVEITWMGPRHMMTTAMDFACIWLVDNKTRLPCDLTGHTADSTNISVLPRAHKISYCNNTTVVKFIHYAWPTFTLRSFLIRSGRYAEMRVPGSRVDREKARLSHINVTASAEREKRKM
jgi:hypothetical protein